MCALHGCSRTSGEHIVSGTVHRLFGYDNVGFHMGRDFMTLDFSGELSPQDIARVELESNRAVWRDAPVRTLLPRPEELEKYDYRSKKELSGQVRLVEIEGVDLCACCAPHVAHTGRGWGSSRCSTPCARREGTRLTVLAGEAGVSRLRRRLCAEFGVSAGAFRQAAGDGRGVRRVLCEKEEEHSR